MENIKFLKNMYSFLGKEEDIEDINNNNNKIAILDDNMFQQEEKICLATDNKNKDKINSKNLLNNFKNNKNKNKNNQINNKNETIFCSCELTKNCNCLNCFIYKKNKNAYYCLKCNCLCIDFLFCQLQNEK